MQYLLSEPIQFRTMFEFGQADLIAFGARAMNLRHRSMAMRSCHFRVNTNLGHSGVNKGQGPGHKGRAVSAVFDLARQQILHKKSTCLNIFDGLVW